ncbi:prolyl oligopeptidase family serine peptidase [Paucibacter sp. APW11]|uniref:Prolyl oligopeptidase family serine peptidase n=1 Tax=Roseateles aquae TaxID=3077235 RepID=A0ABU3PA67_9BURK|nr:prolyl oligopeptidase family serine peptidase [Paucibacter sp. APW11]MDT8999120.1 prolyl oligopeptidase family serine peptidase [Paucibacter sp. APW11]
MPSPIDNSLSARPCPAAPTPPSFAKAVQHGSLWLSLALLSACGGSPSPAPAPKPPEPEPVITGPGEFKAAAALPAVSIEAINTALRAAGAKAPAITPRYAVTPYRIEYLTIDGSGQTVRASGLVCVPAKPSGALSPLLAYQHGTTAHDAEVPSNHAVADEAAVVMASAGYIVLAPDYVGYGVSKGQPHPYLLSAPSAAAVNDLLTASATWRKSVGIADNQQLFLAGYSEGGYTTVAAARALSTATTKPLSTHRAQLQSVVVGAGPYQTSVTMDELLRLVKADNPLLAAVLNPGFLKLLGSDVRAKVRNELLKKALGSDADVVFQSTFLDNYLADDNEAIERLSNVHNWKPEKPLRFYHGRDDRTVPYPSSTVTLQAMQAQGAGALLSLTDCGAQPAGHLECVKPYWDFMMGEFARDARDL